TDLFKAIVENVEHPNVEENGPFQMQISSLYYSNFTGTIGIGRIQRGKIKTNTTVTIVNVAGEKRIGRVLQILGYLGL
ncbi:translational GTPase TypA, partial [Francisella tularensis subsp. holarctica]|nr:translational GTPase TypA [Francisella tularensis subsp. holarctica]